MLLEKNRLYSNKELAAWFEISEGAFKNHKKKKLEYLSLFADFEIRKGKVFISEVYEPAYMNPGNKEHNDKLYQKAIARIIKQYPLQLFVTCAGRVMQSKDKELERLQHKFSTCYQYVRRNLKIIADGSSREWCQRLYRSEIDFIPLDDEQLNFWKEVLNKTLGAEQSEIIAEIKSQQDQKELTDEEAEKFLSNLVSYQWARAKDIFHNKYGFEPVSVACWELNAIIIKLLEEN